MGLCECGCGEDAGVYAANSKGNKKGEPKRFIDHHNNKRRKFESSICCENGHLRTPENSYPSWVKEGKLRCKICTEGRVKKQKEEGTHWSQKEENIEAKRKSQKFIGMKFAYGLTREQYEALLEKQEGRCAICAVTMDSSKPSLIPSVDHVHTENEPRNSNKQVRGLLCHLCNRGLGQFRDNINILEKAIQYLKETQWNQFKASSLAMDLGLEAGRTLRSQQSLLNEDTYMTFAATASQVN